MSILKRIEGMVDGIPVVRALRESELSQVQQSGEFLNGLHNLTEVLVERGEIDQAEGWRTLNEIDQNIAATNGRISRLEQRLGRETGR